MCGVKARVLVVDDDTDLAEMLGIVLRSEGMEPLFCYDGSEALPTFRRESPDLVLFDLMLPGLDGLAVCRLLRAESAVPIVMLTARGDTLDIVEGLQAGADDYIVKPFKPKELVARIHARLRRLEQTAHEMLAIGDLVIDVGAHVGQPRGRADRRDPAGVRPARSRWPPARGTRSPGSSCSPTSGATGTSVTPDWSTSTCSGCAARSSWIPRTPRSS